MKLLAPILLALLTTQVAYSNGLHNLQKMPALMARFMRNPSVIANLNNITQVLATSSKAELRAYLDGNWRNDVENPLIVRQVEAVVKMKLYDRPEEEIINLIERGNTKRSEYVADVLQNGDHKQVILLLFKAKSDPSIITEDQIIEIIDRGLENRQFLTAIIFSRIAKSKYWASQNGWIDYFLEVVEEPKIKELLIKTVHETLNRPETPSGPILPIGRAVPIRWG